MNDIKPTRRLFDEDSHLFSFTALVLDCTPADGGLYDIILDQTAFFPEGGGQSADPGTLGGIGVSDVRVDSHRVIHHYLASPLDIGATVSGSVDALTRTDRMVQHSAEHIISGLVFRRFGLSNVGFHLGDADTTLDFDGLLTREQLNEIEDAANRVIRACLPVYTGYPAPDELAAMFYRSKLDLTENVRIVRIGDMPDPVDVCACCAPHVKNTGEIGCVKLLDTVRNRGGIRVHLVAGDRLITDLRRRYDATYALACAMSVGQTDIVSGYEKLVRQLGETASTLSDYRRRLQELTVSAMPDPEPGEIKNVCLIENGLSAKDMQHLFNRAVLKCTGLCGVFTGNDAAGYSFVVGRAGNADVLPVKAALFKALNARGGGSSQMLQGKASCDRETVLRVFDSFTV